MVVLIAFIVMFSIVMNQRKRLILAEAQLYDLKIMGIGKWMDRTAPQPSGPDRMAPNRLAKPATKDWRSRAYDGDVQPPIPVHFPAQSLADVTAPPVNPAPQQAQAAAMPTAQVDASTPSAITVTVQLR